MSLVFVHDALPGRVRFGPGAVVDVRAEVERLGGSRVLLIGGRGSAATVIEGIADDLGARCLGWFDDVAAHVPGELAVTAVETALDLCADVLVCVGGGSAIGTAKIVALELGQPILAVPTTYAGSEMTPIWGTTSDGRKRTGRDLRALPRTVVYDPDLTRSMPPHVSGPSGMNAMAHAVEGLYAPGTNPVVRLLAVESIRVLCTGLPGVVAMEQTGDALGFDDVPAALFELLGALGIDGGLTGVGMPADAFDDAVDAVVAADPTSPRRVTRDAIEAMLRGAFDGTPPTRSQD